MAEQWEVRFYEHTNGSEPVKKWLDELAKTTPTEYARARHHIDLLEEFGPFLSEPYTRQLKGKLRELRPGPWRVTYFADPQRRMILLTSFRKRTRTTPRSEINRAERLMKDWVDRMRKDTR